MLTSYPACFFPEETGYSVIFPDLNCVATCGDTLDEAMVMAMDCLAGYIGTCWEDGSSIPVPSNPSGIDPITIAHELGIEADGSFVHPVTVDVAEYAKAHFGEMVQRTVSLPVEIDRAALEAEIDLSQVLLEALTDLLQHE